MDYTFSRHYILLLLVLIVEGIDINGYETSQEHRQSRVTGRIVKLYSGVRPDPVLCTGEGFQADPSNCAIFYRCMKSGNGKYTVFRFQCGPGTIYDPETEVCNHPRSTKRSECGGKPRPGEVDSIKNNEIEGNQHEIPSPITHKPTSTNTPTFTQSSNETEESKLITAIPWVSSRPVVSLSSKRQIPEITTRFTTTNPWESTIKPSYTDNTVMVITESQKTFESLKLPSTTVSASPKPISRGNICTSDGFMGDDEDCRKFYRCVANQRGTYTRFEFSCSESTIWDDDTQSCNHAWAVKRSRCGRNSVHTNKVTYPDTRFSTENKEFVQKAISEDQTIQQQLQVSFGSKVTQTQTQISNGSVIQNQTQIHYGDRYHKNKGTRAKQNQTQISYGSAISQTQTQIDYSDKGIQTQLQIDHSQQSSQTQIQIHDSTTQVNSSPMDSSTNQGSNKCDKSGFMGDINDCTIFYRCIENGRGGFAKYEFSCGEGTLWDQSIEACNHAWAVKDCGSKGSLETTSTAYTTISSSKSTQNYHTPVSTENYHTTPALVATDYEDSGYGHQNQNPTTLSTTSTKPITMISNSNCQSSGFIGDVNDCKVFYRCVENSKGSFTKYEFKCGEGTVWDPDLEACNHAWAVKKCGGNTSLDINKTETTTNRHTTHSTDNTQNSITTHSTTTESVATQNDDDDTGYGPADNDLTSSTTSSTEKPQNVDPVTGTICQSSGFMGDVYDCKKFYRCVDNGSGGYTRYEFTCGEGTVWDSKIEACNHAWAVEKCGGSGAVIDHQEATTQSKPTTDHDLVASNPTEGHQITSSSTVITSTITESASADNVCIHSGFVGDLRDCKKFYRCVDNGNGVYTKYEFSCGEGTVWDQRIEACNHAWAVEKCGTVETSDVHRETTTQYHPIMSDEIHNGYPSNIDSGYDIITQSTTTYSTTKTSANEDICITNGFIGDKIDCKKFYRCVEDGKDGFIRYEFSCGEGTLWDQSIEACNHVWAVKTHCGETGNETIHTPGESSTQVTSTSEPEDQGYPQYTEKTSTSTASNYPDNEIEETCDKEGFLGDRKDCKKFYRCVDNGRGAFTKYEFTCGEGTYWNQEILACDHTTPENSCGRNQITTQNSQHEIYTEATTTSNSSATESGNGYPTQKPQASSEICTSEGFYGDQKDCKKFYRCVDNGNGRYTKYDFTCGDGTIWDNEIQACNHESSQYKCFSSSRPTTSQTVSSSSENGFDGSVSTSAPIHHTTEKTETPSTAISIQCTSEGFFADPNDCKKFIRCVSNEKGGYTKYKFSCGEGTIWVQDILACDHNTDNSICISQVSSKPSPTKGQEETTESYEPGTSTSEQTIDKQEDEYDSGKPNESTHLGSNDCSSEGFHANENDCRQFYRCVDNGKGGYTQYNFTCSEGTAWDSDIQVCNHIEQVKSCREASGHHPIMHDEDNSQPTESSDIVITTTSESSSNAASENKYTCNNEGYYGDSEDCKKFYRCVDNGNGGYTKYDFICGEGTIWDQDVITCNHPQDVVNPSCKQKQEGSATSTTTLSSGSSSSGTSEATITTKSPQSSSNCSQEETSKKPENQDVKCSKGGYYANPKDCKKFYRCVDWDGDGKRFSVYHFECGEGTIWDPAVETCNHEESVYPPRDCSGTQSQSENQPPITEGTSTTQEPGTSTQESISESSTEQITTQQSVTSEHTTTQQSTTPEQTIVQQSTTSEQTTTHQNNPTTTQSLTTSEQSTQQISTSEQTTQQSTTSEQTTTQQSTTLEQMTQTPTTSEQITIQSTTDESTTAEQTTQELTTAEQTTQELTTAEQTTQAITTSQQTTTPEQSSTQDSSTTKQSTTQESSTTEQYTTQETFTTEKSTTQESYTSDQSTTQESITEQSPSTTESLTTKPSTTLQSTTESDQASTQDSTSSQGSTTEVSNTEQSTIGETNESTTTEISTNETSSENKCPEIDENQNLFVCPTSFRRHPKYCNLFYQCDEDEDTHDVKIAVFTCPNNTIYDESQTRCVNESKADKKCDGQIAQKRRLKTLNKNYKEPIVVDNNSQACSSAGYFSFEKDSECSPLLLKCKTDKTKKLRGMVYQCPAGYVFWSISRRCEPLNRVRDCKRSNNNWTGRWEIPIERRNVAPF